MPYLPSNPPEPSAAVLPFMAQHGRAWKATRRAPWIVSAFERHIAWFAWRAQTTRVVA